MSATVGTVADAVAAGCPRVRSHRKSELLRLLAVPPQLGGQENAHSAVINVGKALVRFLIRCRIRDISIACYIRTPSPPWSFAHAHFFPCSSTKYVQNACGGHDICSFCFAPICLMLNGMCQYLIYVWLSSPFGIPRLSKPPWQAECERAPNPGMA